MIDLHKCQIYKIKSLKINTQGS